MKKKSIIIGAGPAGITAGIELLKQNVTDVTILERESFIGGLARTTEYKNNFYDVGPHHFITNHKHIEQWWKDLMEGDFHEHKRFTRIYYKRHFFFYPLQPINALLGLRAIEALRCIASYVYAQVWPRRVCSFEDYVTNKFGYRLYSIFFKTYSEKVWGIKCTQISADWAAQRIKGFSLSKAIFYAFFGKIFKKQANKTLSEVFSASSDLFYYPAKGSGVLWNKAAQQLLDRGGVIEREQDVIALEHDQQRIIAVHTRHGQATAASVSQIYSGDYFFSTMPLRDLVNRLIPQAPELVIRAADALRYRGLITVNLLINRPNWLPDHWMYIHEKDTKVMRIGIMNNFSQHMVDDQQHTSFCLEYFEFVGTEFWKKTEEELKEIAKQELVKLGLVSEYEVIDGMVQWSPEAYPIYDAGYKTNLDTVRTYLAGFSNLQLMGRNGMHSYCNMDVAMLSAFSAVENVVQAEQASAVLATEQR